jgi:hypothetical protein
MSTPIGSNAASRTSARPRPRWLRALGTAEPPEAIVIGVEPFQRISVFKHDSWAATALYGDSQGRRRVVKFHRQQGLPGVPMRWFGRLMARHEARFLARLADLDQVPTLAEPVSLDGRVLPHAVGRDFIPGHPLARNERVDDDFFPALQAILLGFHRRGLAYVDLHKRENIIVDDRGRPCLIDFQISVAGSRTWPFSAWLKVLQECDLYHLRKHWAKLRPDQFGATTAEVRAAMPWWIRAHRLIAQPFRQMRRGVLVRVGVRTGRGRSDTEVFPEDAVLRERERESGPVPHHTGLGARASR